MVKNYTLIKTIQLIILNHLTCGRSLDRGSMSASSTRWYQPQEEELA